LKSELARQLELKGPNDLSFSLPNDLVFLTNYTASNRGYNLNSQADIAH
jgi:hypothetical protein